MAHDELARCLRSWRDRLAPDAAGLPAAGAAAPPACAARRSPGWPACRSTTSPGSSRAAPTTRPPSVLGRAGPRAAADRRRARAPVPRRRAGRAGAPGASTATSRPGVQRILDRLADVPVTVLDAAWPIVAANPLAVALPATARARRSASATSPGGTSPARRRGWCARPQEDAAMAAEAVADLHDALGRHPDDEPLRALIADLRAAQPALRRAVGAAPGRPARAGRKTFQPPRGRRDHARLRRPDRRATATCG